MKYRFGLVVLVIVLAFSAIVSSAQTPVQIVVDPDNPQWLYYNQDSNHDGKLDPFYMAGAGGPEGFLYLSPEEQAAIIDAIGASGSNALYMHMVRSHGGDGGSNQNPFIDNNPDNGVDQAVLDAWDGILAELDSRGIVVLLFFYDDSAAPFAVETPEGQEPDDTVGETEAAFIQAVVNTFEHHGNIIWGIAEEYEEALTDAKASAIAAEIAAADDYNHAIAIHHLGGNTMNFPDDPNIDQFAQQSNATSPQALYADVREAVDLANGRYNVNMAENWNEGVDDQAQGLKDGNRSDIRLRNWATGMAGGYVMVVGTWEGVGAPPTSEMLSDWGRQKRFFEITNFDEMRPNDDLKAGGTEYLLAKPGESYILYASNLSGELGLMDMQPGNYSFMWFDPATGASVEESRMISAGEHSWPTPAGIGSEVALYVRKVSDAQVFPGESWDTRTLAEVGLDEALINQFIENVGGTGVIIKDGYLVASWGGGGHGDWASAVKPLWISLMLFAIDEGRLSGVDQQIANFGWDLTEQDQTMTFSHLANMTSGYVRGEVPGEAFAYNDYGISLYLKTLFDRVYGIDSTNADAVMSLVNNELGALQFEDGSFIQTVRGGPRLTMTPRDFARIGWWWLNRGNWQGEQLLPVSYFDTYMQPQVPNNLPLTGVEDVDYLDVDTIGGDSNQVDYGPGLYGYGWWFNCFVGMTNDRAWPGAPADTFQASGHWYREIMTIIPSLNLVVAARGDWGVWQPGNADASMNTNLNLLTQAAMGTP